MAYGIEELFGWLFDRKPTPEPLTFSPKTSDDGAVVIAASGAFGTYIDLDGTVRSDAELITRYREMSMHPECDSAIDEIVNEMIAGDEADTVKIVLDDLNQSDTIKEAIEDAFSEVLELLDFRHHAYDLVRRWYIDGRCYFHTIINETNTKEGIKEIRYIDPRKIRKIREVLKKRVKGQESVAVASAVVTQTKNEYFIYSDKGFSIGNQIANSPTTGIKIAKDAICYVTSGLTDSYGSRVLSYLHKAIKALNQLRTLEDASVIYRLARSSERRIWYIDVGNLPRMKAEQYVRDMMIKHKNRLTYDGTSGEIIDDRKFMNLLEDYWLPQRDGKGTKVDVLPPGTSFNQIDDILYFLKKLYISLHVPVGRIDAEDQVDLLATQITRDEIKFGKLITRLRVRFSALFVSLLEKQLVLKGVMSIEDYQKISAFIRFDYVKDNPFAEMKDQQVYTSRMTLLGLMGPYVGRYYSNAWIRRNILHQTDEEIKEMDKEIQEEMNDPQFEGMPGAPPEEGESGVLSDPGEIPEGPSDSKPKDTKAKPTPKGTPSFKSVGKILSKGT